MTFLLTTDNLLIPLCQECGSMAIENKYLQLCASCNCAKRKPKKEIKKRGFIGKLSKKMKVDLAEYTKLRRQFLKENPMCAVYADKKATTIHHKKGRGKYLLDMKTWLAVSMEAHIKIEENPAWAKKMGYSKSRL